MKVPLSTFREAGELVFLSGQIYLKNGVLVEGSIKDKTRQVMSNIQAILSEAGLGFDNVVKATIYVTNMGIYADLNEVYAGYFSEGNYPAREVIGVRELPLGAEIEICVIAKRSV